MSDVDSPYELDALVADAEWRALASIIWHQAVAKSRNATPATGVVGRLAAAASDEPAFEELWRLLGLLESSRVQPDVTDQLWATTAEQMPESVSVPNRLLQEVEVFVTGEADDRRERHDPLRRLLLVGATVSDDTRRAWARTLLQDGAAPSRRGLRQDAYALLAEAPTPRDQSLLIQCAAKEPQQQETLRLLRQVPVDHRTEDVHRAIADALKPQPLPDSPNNREKPIVQALVELPQEQLAEVLKSDWTNESRAGLQRIDLATQLNLKQLQHVLVGAGLPDWLRQRLLEGARDRTPDEMLQWARWLRDHDESAAQELVDYIVDHRVSGAAEDEVAAEQLRVAVNHMATEHIDDRMAAALCRLHSTEQLLAVLRTHTPADRQLGQTLAADTTFEQCDHDAIADAVKYSGEATLDLLDGFLQVTIETPNETVAQALFERADSDPAAVQLLLKSPLRSPYLEQLPNLPADIAITALALPDTSYSQHELDHLTEATHWQRTTTEQFVAAVEHLTRHSEAATIRLAGQAIESVDLPQAAQVGSGHLKALLDVVLNRSLGSQLAEAAPRGIETLLQAHVTRDVRQLTCRWAAKLHPTETLVDAIAAADETTVDLQEEFQHVRVTQAEHLLREAEDDAADWTERGDALRVATRADSSLARATALDLLARGQVHVDLQLAAVEALRIAGLHTADIEQAEIARDSTVHRAVRRQLETLLNRVTSGTHAEALSNLFDMLGLDHQADVEVLLPIESLREAFQSAADKVRRDESGAPDNYILQVTSLADHLLEMALLMGNHVGEKWVNDSEAALIVKNAAGKPHAGAKAKEQNLQQALPWVVAVAHLHTRRLGHASPRGSTNPPTFTPEDSTWATQTLHQVVDGWVATMHSLATRALKSSG